MAKSKPRHPGWWGLIQLHAALHRMRASNKAGADAAVLEIGERYWRRWKGNAAFYARMAGAHWGLSHWADAVRCGRRALALNSQQPQTVIFLLASYRALNPLRGIAFGERWLDRHGPHPDVCRHLSFLYDDLDRHADALAVARRGLRYAPNQARLAACAANYLAKVEGAEAALAFAQENRRLFSRDPYCEKVLADGLSAIRAYSESEKLFLKLHRRNPDDAAALEGLLDAWFRLGRHREMLEAVQEWQRCRRITAALANEAGRACLELGRGDEALTWIARAVELAPSNAKFADNYAITLGRAGRFLEGIDAAKRRLDAPDGPDRRRLLTSIAVDLTQLGRHADALVYYEKAYTEFPGNTDALVDFMTGLLWVDRMQEAIELGDRHRVSGGRNLPSRFWSEYAWALHRAQRYPEEERAVRDWRVALPADVNVLRALKRVLNALDRREEALQAVRGWAEAHRTEAWAWRYLAEQQQECGDAAGELASLAEACRLAPADPDFAAAHLVALRRHGRQKEALDLGAAWVATHREIVSAELFNRIGLAADDLEKWRDAEFFYRRAHEADPSDEFYAGNLIRALIFLDRAADGADHGRKWLARYPWSNYVAKKQAWALRSAALLEEESDVLRRAAQADPADAEVKTGLLANLAARGLTEDAGRWVEECRAAGTHTAALYNDWGNLLRDGGRLGEAEKAYRDALAIGPDNEVAAGNLASLLVHRERASEALQLCREWLARRPGDRYVRRQLAHALYTVDDYPPGEAEYRQLLVDEPDSAFLFGRFVACLRLQGKFDEALASATAWLVKNPGTAFLFTEMGIAAHRLNQAEKAVGYFDAALKLEPESYAAALRKLNVLGELRRLDEAIAFGEAWKTAHPAEADGDFHNNLGILLDRAGRTELAEQSFVEAARRAPHNAVFAGNVVEILARRGKVSESLQFGQRFLAGSPPDGYLLRRLGEVYAERAESGAALDVLSSADALEPGDPDIALAFLRIALDGDELPRGVEFGRGWLARSGNERQASVWAMFARVCFRADHDDEAFSAAATAIELEPDELRHVQMRFGFWTALGENNRVLQEFEALRPEWHDDPQLLQNVSRAYGELGLAAEALATAARNASLNPADEEACAWLARQQERQGARAAAWNTLRRWIEVHGEHPAVLRVRASLLLEQNRHDAALADAEKVLQARPADEESFSVAVQALRALGRGREARSRLNHWIEYNGTSPRISRLLDEAPDGGD